MKTPTTDNEVFYDTPILLIVLFKRQDFKRQEILNFLANLILLSRLVLYLSFFPKRVSDTEDFGSVCQIVTPLFFLSVTSCIAQTSINFEVIRLLRLFSTKQRSVKFNRSVDIGDLEWDYRSRWRQIKYIEYYYGLVIYLRIHEEFDVLITSVVRSCWDWIWIVWCSDEDCRRILLLLSSEASSHAYILTFGPPSFPWFNCTLVGAYPRLLPAVYL